MSVDDHEREALVGGLISIGERGIAVQDDAALEAYFSPDFVFHGPDGDLSFDALRDYFASMREAFTDFTVTRDHAVVEAPFVAVETTMAGTFTREFTQSPVGPLPPTGQPFTLRIHNIFRYDDSGRLAEEWAQMDNLGFLRQLGALRSVNASTL